MDALSIQSALQTPLPVPAKQAPVLPKAEAPALPAARSDEATVDAQVKAAEQRRFEAIKNAAQDIANVYVLGDTRFTIFKDATGQYITRFTNLRDGKITYYPEPEMLKLAGAASPAVLSIKA